MHKNGDGSPPFSAAAILVAAGRGVRAGPGLPKQYRPLGGIPLLARSLRPFTACPEIRRNILVVPDVEEARVRLSDWLPGDREVHLVRGGETRQDSVAAGLGLMQGEDLVLVHDGVRPFVTQQLIRSVLGAAAERGAAVPTLPVRETLKRLDSEGRILRTERREDFALSQTPQGFRREILESALRKAEREGYQGTDEGELVERLGKPVARVEGLEGNMKITTPDDQALAEAALSLQEGAPSEGMRVGIGYDVHPLVLGRRLVLGGVEIPHPSGPGGHSDGDLVCHAAIDALLGAAGLPDIGALFPDSDGAYRDASSLRLLARTGELIRKAGFVLANLDLVVAAEEPRIAPHVSAMREALGKALACEPARIGIKGKRGEGLGFVGRREGLAAHAVALLLARRGGRSA
jgi:2-C-methyl-D-erythritol 4-phosphate cytidylyltransferase / 2-C-methyl-D-erythritol 2,4-cyclodiphosphate synthase